MARLRFILHGNLGGISARTFIRFIDDSLKVLSQLDRAASNERNGTLDWTVADLKGGSTVVDVESRVRRGDDDLGSEVSHLYKNGLAQLQVDAHTPAFFTTDSLRLVRDIVREIRRDGVTGASIALPESGERVDFTPELAQNLEVLVGVHHKSLGAVEGRLELVSLHRPYRRFNVYDTATGRGVKCSLPAALEDKVIQAIKRRVIASGTVSYNAVGEPLSVQVNNLRVLRREDELPATADLTGSQPDLTGDLSTAAYLRSIRGG